MSGSISPTRLTGTAKSGDIVCHSYRLLEKVGKGSSGTVWSARDLANHDVVAIKILQWPERWIARDFMRLSRRIQTLEPKEMSLLALPLDHAQHVNRDCFVFDLFPGTLREVIENNILFPLPAQHIRAFTWQIFSALAYLHDLRIIHTDIKPENIAIMNLDAVEIKEMDKTGAFQSKVMLKSPELKIIDLDGATECSTKLWTRAGTWQYLAPEVLCDLGWDQAADVFSAACTVYELYTAKPLIPFTKNIRMIMAHLDKIVGRPSRAFERDLLFNLPEIFDDDAMRVTLPSSPPDGEEMAFREMKEARPLWMTVRRVDLLDFLRKTLASDADDRLSATGALRHGYLSLFPQYNSKIEY